MIRLLLLFAVALFSLHTNGAAQESAPGKLPRESVEALGRQAHDLLPKAQIGPNELIGEEKAQTLKYPLIPYELMEFVVIRGNMAGFAAHCGLDWQKTFYMPLMSFLRSREKDFSVYQWAYVGILHGVAMGGAEHAIKGKPCPPEMKENLMKAAK